MYDQSRVSKPIHFVHFVLKFTERLSSEYDFQNSNSKTPKSHTCLDSITGLWWNEGTEEVKIFGLECIHLRDWDNYYHMCVVYSTELGI